MKQFYLVAAVSAIAIDAQAVNLIIDPGFETDPVGTSFGEGTVGAEGPGDAGGVWSGDSSRAEGNPGGTAATPGGPVTPHSGDQMLRFVRTIPDSVADGFNDTNSDVTQLISLSTYSTAINANTATITIDGWVYADDGVLTGSGNTGFLFEVRFMDGVIGDWDNADGIPTNAPGNLHLVGPPNPLYLGGTFIEPTVAVATWTQLSLGTLPIPVGTDFMMIRIAARENVVARAPVTGAGTPSNPDTPEFFGMFADDFSADINADENTGDPPIPVIPEPARAALLLLGAFGMIARRRRK